MRQTAEQRVCGSTATRTRFLPVSRTRAFWCANETQEWSASLLNVQRGDFGSVTSVLGGPVDPNVQTLCRPLKRLVNAVNGREFLATAKMTDEVRERAEAVPLHKAQDVESGCATGTGVYTDE